MLEESMGVLRPNRLQCSAYRRVQRFAGARPGFAHQRLKPGDGFFHGVEVGLVWRQPGCVARGCNSHTFLPWRTDWRTAPPYCSASAATSSRQNAGISGTTRPQTRLPSRNAALSTQVAPAFCRSSLIPSEPVALAPSTMPAEIATSPPWQMIPTVLFLSYTVLTRSVISG